MKRLITLFAIMLALSAGSAVFADGCGAGAAMQKIAGEAVEDADQMADEATETAEEEADDVAMDAEEA